MPIHNAEIAEIFNEYADLLEIKGANQYRVRAYRTAARNISNLSRSTAEMVSKKEDISKLPGLGKDLAGKVADIVNTGKLPQLEDLKKELPAELIDISKLEGLGPKRTGVLYQNLGITSIEQLEEAAKKQEIRELPGFAAKTEQKIIEEIGRKGEAAGGKKRYKLSVIEELAQPLLAYLKKVGGVKRVEAAGSYRRRKETVGDLDILVTHEKKADVMKQFVEYEDVERVISKGDTRSTVVLRFGVQVDLRAVAEESYGAALHYFTGSQAHNIAVRKMGVKQKLKINEYGVFRDEKRIAGKTEDEVYNQVDLPYMEPELRENNGEIEAAQEGNLPELVMLEDICGDLHAHTKATDGRSSLEEMAVAAKEKGYEYLAITDHSKHVTVAKGLDANRLAEQIEEIDRLNEKLDGIVLLKSIEVDILEDGSLDLPDDILERLDLVVCAVHYKFNLPVDKQTERIIKGIDNPYFTILAHPTGRLIGEREPYQLDMERLMKAAKETGSALELNAQPDRLDLTDVYAKMAKEAGIMVAISTDAHSVNELDFMRFGVYQGRRGWLESGDILNAKSWKDLKKMLRKK
ncbi:MAG: DNA polymerase/3'-5' exonuclease PolX [Chloroflexota bacterium]